MNPANNPKGIYCSAHGCFPSTPCSRCTADIAVAEQAGDTKKILAALEGIQNSLDLLINALGRLAQGK